MSRKYETKKKISTKIILHQMGMTTKKKHAKSEKT